MGQKVLDGKKLQYLFESFIYFLKMFLSYTKHRMIHICDKILQEN